MSLYLLVTFPNRVGRIRPCPYLFPYSPIHIWSYYFSAIPIRVCSCLFVSIPVRLSSYHVSSRSTPFEFLSFPLRLSQVLPFPSLWGSMLFDSSPSLTHLSCTSPFSSNSYPSPWVLLQLTSKHASTFYSQSCSLRFTSASPEYFSIFSVPYHFKLFTSLYSSVSNYSTLIFSVSFRSSLLGSWSTRIYCI